MAGRAREAGAEQAASVLPTGRRRRRAAAPAIGVEVHADLDALPAPVAEFLAVHGERDFFSSLAWFRIVLRTAGSPHDEPRLYSAQSGGRVTAVLVVRERVNAGPLKTHVVTGPSRGLDAAFFRPLLDPEEGESGLRAIVASMVGGSPAVHLFRFEALDPGAPECKALETALRERHMLIQTLADPFRLYTEDVDGLTFERYLERRSPQMREFIQRQVDAFAQSARGRFEIATEGPGLKSALVDYALVDLQSWKQQDRYPDCLDRLIETASRAGLLRLGILYVGDRPAAAQVWIVSAGRATIWRSRFARQFASLSVGAVLTYEMIRHVLAADRPREIEFGPADEIGHQQWLSRRRDRIGLAVFNLRTAKGCAAAMRHFGGLAVRRMVQAARRMRGELAARFGRAA